MEAIEQYRIIIRTLIEHYASYQPARGDVEIEVIFDQANDHYELMYSGWNGPYRIQGSVLHIDIRNGKVWVQHDGTDVGIADELVEAGIPRDQIVIGFKSPDMRPSPTSPSPNSAQGASWQRDSF